MIKEATFYRKQASQSEQMAHLTSSEALAEELLNLAEAFRNQAAVLKASKIKTTKSGKPESLSKFSGRGARKADVPKSKKK